MILRILKVIEITLKSQSRITILQFSLKLFLLIMISKIFLNYN